MPELSGTVQGYALLDVNGLILWDTFTTRLPQPSLGYIQVYKILCNCSDNECGVWMYDYTPSHAFYNRTFVYDADGSITIDFEYGTIPTKYIVKQNGTEIFDSGFGGLAAYQAALDNFVASNGLPSEIIDPTPPSSTNITITTGDIITVEVICIAPEKSSHRFRVGCIGGAINCVVSPWGDWGKYVVTGDFTQVCRTRERTITTPPAGGGTPCPPLSETECENYEDREIQVIIRTDAIFDRNLSDIVLFEGDPGQKTPPDQVLTTGTDIMENLSASPYMAGVKLNDDSGVLSDVSIFDGNGNSLYTGSYTSTLDIQFNILITTGLSVEFFNPIIININ